MVVGVLRTTSTSFSSCPLASSFSKSSFPPRCFELKNTWGTVLRPPEKFRICSSLSSLFSDSMSTNLISNLYFSSSSIRAFLQYGQVSFLYMVTMPFWYNSAVIFSTRPVRHAMDLGVRFGEKPNAETAIRAKVSKIDAAFVINMVNEAIKCSFERRAFRSCLSLLLCLVDT